MTIINRTATILTLVLTMILTASVAQATVFGFEVVEGSFDTANYQLTVESVNGGSSVAFTFTNTAGDDSALTSLYWDFGDSASSFSTPSSWTESDGVDYTGKTGSWLDASPSNMPGGSTIDFYSDFGMNPDKKGGSIHNGIGSGESLTVVLDLQGSASYEWLLSALDSGDVRVGFHLQGLGVNGELSATGVTTSATPIPAAAWLLGSGMAGLLGLRRRNRA